MDLQWIVDQPRNLNDWNDIRGICVKTAANAADLNSERRVFFEEFWITPYRKLAPHWTWVLRMGPRERVIGYLCSAPDTASFNERRTLWVRFPLLVGVLRGRIPWSLEAKNWIKRGLRLLPDVERSFDAEILQNLRSEYPAHLHINLDPTVQRGGGGSRLIEAMLEKMKTEEVPGVHLFCGQGPVAFYEKQGFRVISQISFGPKQVAVFAMARKTRLN